MIQKFCTECGKTLSAGNTFCGECGAPVTLGVPQPEVNRPAEVVTPQAPAVATGSERVAGIIPFVLRSIGVTGPNESGSFIVTDRRIIFAHTPAAFHQQMIEESEKIEREFKKEQDDRLDSKLDSEIADLQMTEEDKRALKQHKKEVFGGLSPTITDQRKYLNARDWSTGPWQRYASIHPDMIASESPGNLVFLYAEIGSVKFNAKDEYTDDAIYIYAQGKRFDFHLGYAQGPASLTIFHQYLGDRAKRVWGGSETLESVGTISNIFETSANIFRIFGR